MQKSISVVHKLYDGKEMSTIPILYDIIKDGNRTTYDCKVGLNADNIPDWLTITDFQIPIIYTPGSPGVTITAFSDVKGIRNIDTALFVAEVEAQISIAERYIHLQ